MTNANPNAVPIPDSLRDIKPPIEIPNLWLWVVVIAVLVILLSLAVGTLLFFAMRRKVVAVPPLVPPHLRAKQRLQDALALIAQPKPFCIAVSDTVRFYLEERFQFHAPERTTEEFLYELQNTNLLLPDQKESLGEFLKRCDLVKFARYEPRETELRDMHGSAIRLIEETEPEQAKPLSTADAGAKSENRKSEIANQKS
jgi:hypothetical protein